MAPRRKQVGSEDDPRYHSPKVKSRKAMRKAQRKSQKQKHHQNMMQYKERKRQGSVSKAGNKVQSESTTSMKRKHSSGIEEIVAPFKPQEEISDEQREIEYLERQLMKNRKGTAKGGDLFQTLRKEFINDGFDDDLLDFLSDISNMAEKSKRTSKKSNVSTGEKRSSEDIDEDMEEEEEEEDYDDEEVDEVEDDELEEEEYDDDYDDEVGLGEDGELEEEGIDEDEEDEEDYEQLEHDDEKPVKKRVRFDLGDKSNIKEISKEKIKEQDVAPIKFDKTAIESMKRKQMGLINRISEGNFTVVVRQIINIYNKMLSGDNKQKETQLRAVDELIENICDCTIKSIIENENSVISLVAIHTALICALSNTVGINVGYVYCHKLLQTLEKALPVLFQNEDGKQLSDTKLKARNSVMSFAVISELDMLDAETIFYLFKIMSKEEITEHIAQILMVMLRYTGHKMKSQNSASFHKIIEHLNNMLDQYKAAHGDITQSRLRFFQQEIESFKLSKEKKPLETFDFLKNIIKGEFKYAGGSTNPQINHQTLLQFSQSYKTGALSHKILHELDTGSLVTVKTAKGDSDPNSTDALLQKANALRLYSNCQKSTFVAIMGAISPQHAVERIMDIGVKPPQHTEVIYTVVHSLMSEKLYNQYYTEVAKSLARLPSTAGKRFTRANVCTMIAVIEHLHEKKPRKCAHVGRFFGDLVASKILELRLLRFLKKEHADTESVEAFLCELFGFLMTDVSEEDEEHVIAEMMELANEEVFELMHNSWEEYLHDHCSALEPKKTARRVILEACRRIFATEDD
ncbi:nucleolar MIF4G domain-containing protein protein 1 [Babesia ovis]|uniref:Nucleolar MIF4G domain-containing protein protein 1 n=1 Tax=Babesia ovis TaxID=5869 RepID=A0A9W5TAH3_BABOV|nr:nucleolar MIF4G domain-containing protein protein 1 [Babesia ovis]